MSDDDTTSDDTTSGDATSDEDATEQVEAETAAAPTTAAPVATTPAATTVKPDKGKRWQRIVSVVLLVLGFLLVPLSAVAIWTHNQLTNTDRYVETVSPLADNADIQQAVATRAVDALFDNVDVAGEIEDALPRRAKFLGAPVANAMKGYATDVAERFLASDQFQKVWDAANRQAHAQLVALLEDDPSKAPGAVSVKDGKITLDLGKVIDKVKSALVDRGLTFLQNVDVPPVSRSITIIDSEGLSEARSYLGILNTLAWVLPVLGVLALAGSALIVPPRRRRLTIRAALVLVAACAFTLVLLAIGRSLYLDATVNKDAAQAVFDILVRNLRYGIITLGVVGIIIAIVAYFAGPSAPAKMARRYADKGIAGARNKAGDLGLQPNPVEDFVGAHKRVLELVIGGLALLVLVLWDRPGIGAVLFIFVIALILVGVVEFMARGSVPETADDAGASTSRL
jgi:hypothetical protein